jgi:excisionase family DNA binding protein
MEKYLNAKQVMEALNIGRSTVYSLLNRADFPASRIGKRIVVSETALREWLAKGGTAHEKGDAV